MISTGIEGRSSQDVRLALEAMGTRFELVLGPSGDIDVHAAGEEALAEIARLDTHLSFYRSDSDITWINAYAAHQPVKVEPSLFGLLQRCQALASATDGAFDITIGPLMRAWRFIGDTGAVPSKASLARARASVGFRHLLLDPVASTVRFTRPDMSIDLGAAGKGYAVDQAIGIMRARGVTRALLHGGTSSIHVIGAPAGAPAWRIGWHPPRAAPHTFELHDRALSISAVHGKAFTIAGRQYGHVLDPRTGHPTEAAWSVAVTGSDSTVCDALSTALLVLGPSWVPILRARFPGYDGMTG